MIELPCSQCGATLLAEDAWVGKKVKCPDCGGRTLVDPSFGEAVTVPPGPPAEAATLPPGPLGGDSDGPTLPPSGAAPAAGGEAITVAGYEILGELGRGGMGVVYKARHVKLGRLVALKMILVAEHAGPEERARFQTEAEAVARLQHPNIVQIHEVGEQDGRPFFSLEFCGGGSLEKKLSGVPLPPKEAARLAETLARAMHAAHEAGVVHRDLKPANVLLAKDGTPKITDFGLAKKLDEAGQTASGAIMGTPSYMAPEQAGGKSKEIGPHTDVYALGAILYELLTGRPPFRAATALDTVLQVVSDEPVPPTQLQSKTPRDLETICLKCLQKDPHKRYVSAQALAKDLRRFQNGEPVQARPVGRLQRGWRWGRRNPVGAALVAALLLGTAVATGFGVWALREKEQKDRELTRAEWMVYANQLAVAQASWNDNRADLAWDYLDRTRQDYRGWEYRYLATQFLRNQHVFRGHTGPVYGVCFSPDGRRLASAGEQTVRVWDAATGQEVLTLKGHTSYVWNVCFSPDGRRLASASDDKTVRVWDAATGQEVLTLQGHTGPVSGVCFSPDGRRLASASGGFDAQGRALPGEVKVWDAATGQEVLTLKGHTHGVTGVCFSPDGRRLASASYDKTVRVWDAATGQAVLTLKGHTYGVSGVCFSPDGRRLASASTDQTVRVWDADKGQEVLTLQGHTGFVRGVCFSPDGRRLASASQDNTVRVWDAATGQEVLTLQGHTSYVTGVCFSPDGRRLASASTDQTVRVWDAATGQEVLTLKGHTSRVLGVCFSPDGRLASASYDKTVRLWNAETGQEVRALKHIGSVDAVAFSPDGKRLASASGDQTVRVWDAETGQEVRALKGHTGVVHAVAFSPDGKRLASASEDKTVRVWDAATGQEVRTLKGHTSFVHGVCFSPDGRRLASASTDQTVRVWDAATGQEVRTLKGHTHAVTSVCFSPDGRHLASTSWDGTVRVWDADKGQEVLTLKGHTSYVTGVCFSPDGRRLASASYDKTVRVWDAATGREVLTLQGHTSEVTGVCFSPDGRRLASASGDQTVRVWDADTGQEVLTLKGHTHGVTSVCFSPDGRRVFARDQPGKVLAWTVRDGQPTEPINPPNRPDSMDALSPDGAYRALANGNDVQLIDTAEYARHNAWTPPDRAERLRYHGEQARLAEGQQQWFAAAFHLGRLLRDQPDDADLKRRRDAALKNHAAPPPTRMDPAPP